MKLLDASLSENEEVFQRFKREAEIAGQLGHPNIVEVVDFNRTEEGVPFMVMEKLEGEEAFFRMLRWTQGEFTIEHGVRGKHRSVNSDPMFLLMEGLRLMDEEHQHDAEDTQVSSQPS